MVCLHIDYSCKKPSAGHSANSDSPHSPQGSGWSEAGGQGEGVSQTGTGHIGTEAFANPCQLPEGALSTIAQSSKVMLLSLRQKCTSGRGVRVLYRPKISTGANEQEHKGYYF